MLPSPRLGYIVQPLDAIAAVKDGDGAGPFQLGSGTQSTRLSKRMGVPKNVAGMRARDERVQPSASLR